MIKKYNQYIKESLLDKIEGPSEKEFMNTFYTSTPYQFISNATKNGYLKGVEFALEMGIQVFDKPELLTSAVNSNNVDVVKLLIKNEVGKRFLYNGMVRATANNNLEILKLLYKYGPEYLFKTSIVYHSENFDMNLIDPAVTQNSIDCLKFLLRVGVSCNIRKVDKKYPLYLAIISYTTNKDYLEIIKLLLEYGSVVDDTIMECAEKFADDVVYNLIKNKYNEKQGLKESLLDKIEGPRVEDFKQLFLSGGIGFYEYIQICEREDLEFPSEEDMLIYSKNNPNDALITGIKSQNINLIKVSLENNALINPRALDLENPIIIAIQTRNLKIIEYLINNGANINFGDERTPLEEAIYFKYVDVINLLLKYGVNVNKKTISYAEHFGNEKIVDILKKTNMFKQFINKFNKFNESLLDKIEGPSIEKIYTELGLNNLSPEQLFKKSLEKDFYYGMIDAIERGYNPTKYSNILYFITTSNKLKDNEKYEILKHVDFSKISQEKIDDRAQTLAMFNQVKTLELFLQNGANVDELTRTHVARAWIEDNPDVIELIKKYKENSVTIKRKEDNGFISKFKKFVGIDESLLNNISGPNEDDVFKSFGFDKKYDTIDEMLSYLFLKKRGTRIDDDTFTYKLKDYIVFKRKDGMLCVDNKLWKFIAEYYKDEIRSYEEYTDGDLYTIFFKYINKYFPLVDSLYNKII